MSEFKRKITSRKLWMSIAQFVSSLLIYIGVAEAEAERVVCLIMAGGAVIAYVIGESRADAANAGKTIDNSKEPEEEE